MQFRYGWGGKSCFILFNFRTKLQSVVYIHMNVIEFMINTSPHFGNFYISLVQ